MLPTDNDQTGMMGYSYRETNGPRMCFNAFKHHALGWYSSQTEYVNLSNGPWTEEMISFVDAKSDTSKAVIVNVDKVYMQINSAKSFNVGTKENPNQLVFIEGTSGDVESDKLGGIGSAGSKMYLSGNVVVELCSINVGGSVDTARVSIYNSKTQSSGCNGADTSSSGNTSIGISQFKFVDTQTNAEVNPNCSTCLGGVSKLGVYAETYGTVNSVEFKLSGGKSRTHSENVAPFSLFGDGGRFDKIWAGDMQSGSYRLEATAYPMSNKKGNASAVKVLEFDIA